MHPHIPTSCNASHADHIASPLRLLSLAQTAAISNGSLARLLRPSHAQVLIGARSDQLFAFRTGDIQSIQPRSVGTPSQLGPRGPIELKLPTPCGPPTELTRDVMLTLSGVQARITFDRLLTTHRLNVEALADPQDLVPSAWLLGYFELGGTPVAMIDPSALLPVRL